MTPSNPLTQIQQRRNSESVGSWAFAESHRQRVTQLLLDQRSEDNPQLCVLGAGNCTDLDLAQLTANFQKIDLLDVDLAALKQGIVAQGCQESDCLALHGECDVTGVWQQLALLADKSTDDGSDIDQLLAQSEAWPGLADVGPYSTVVSACMLSQLIDGVIHSLGESHPRCLEVIAAIRQRHLRLLYELTAPDGQAILITDFVSSETAPALPTLTGKALADTLQHMISQHNFFTGLNPFRLQALLTEDPYFVGKIHSIRCEQPWLWNFGPRHYAVTAISFRKGVESSV